MELERLLKDLGWGPSKLARHVSVDEGDVIGWLYGELEAPQWLFDYLRAMTLLRGVLSEGDDVV